MGGYRTKKQKLRSGTRLIEERDTKAIRIFRRSVWVNRFYL